MLQSPERRWIGAGIVGCLLLAFLGWNFLIGPQRDQASESRQVQVDAETQTAALRARVLVLARRFAEIDQARAALEVKRQALPADNELDTLVVDLNRAGATTGVTIEAVTPEQPIDITPVAPTPPKPPEGEDEEAEEPEDGAAPVAPPPVVTAWPLFVLPVTIRASGSFADMEDFLRAVQSEQPRAILFTAFTLTGGDTGDTFADRVILVAQTRVFVGPVVAADVEAPTGD